MRIGIDFDNTLACYDRVFAKLALEMGLSEQSTKRDVRQLVRQREEGERLWQCIQGKAYGVHMREAEQFMGEDSFLRRCAALPNVQVFIVSHKTEYGHYDETRTSLREAARQWMRSQGFFDPEKYAIPEERLFFEATRQEKVVRIASLECDVFIDDLAEVFANPLFPQNTRKILFANEASAEAAGHVDSICASWPEIEAVVFGS